MSNASRDDEEMVNLMASDPDTEIERNGILEDQTDTLGDHGDQGRLLNGKKGKTEQGRVLGCFSNIWNATKHVTRRVFGLKTEEEEIAYEAAWDESQEAGEHSTSTSSGPAQSPLDKLADFGTGETTASWLSIIFFLWCTPFVYLGRKRPLFMKDLGKLMDFLNPITTAEALAKNWQKELDRAHPSLKTSTSTMTHSYDAVTEDAKSGASLLRALFYTYRWKFLIIAVPRLWRLTTGILTPYLLNRVIKCVEDPTAQPKWVGLLFVLALLVDMQIGSVLFQHYCQFILKAEISIKSGITSLLYAKLLRLSATAKQSNVHGKLMNLIGSDTDRVTEWCWFGHFFWLTPAMVVVCFTSVSIMLGVYPALAGFGLLIIVVPLSALVAKKLEGVREAQTVLTDARVKTTNEIFATMKTVKLYALEDHFAQGADEARRLELEAIKRLQLWKAFHESINDGTIPLMSLASFLTFILRGGTLTPSMAFSLIGIYNAIHWPFLMITSSISATVEAHVSVGRIQEFLELPEIPGLDLDQEDHLDDGDEQVIDLDEPLRQAISTPKESLSLAVGEISIKNASFAWEFDECLRDITLHCPPGSLTCIVGPVGSGKSSLLNVLLGEIRHVRGSGSIKSRGKISYAPQTPFLLHATVRENICFGCPFDAEKYARTIECCALQADLDMLLAGDLTVIGERGINLSGGQKARISMARAVYSDCQICLLDDPLSAVDAHVGHKLFNDCVKVLLKGKTVLLVTHQLQFVNHGDQLVVMADGKIEHFGSPAQLKASGVDVAALLEKFNEELDKHAAEHAAQNAAEGAKNSLRDSLQESLSAASSSGDASLRDSYASLRLSSSSGVHASADQGDRHVMTTSGGSALNRSSGSVGSSGARSTSSSSQHAPLHHLVHAPSGAAGFGASFADADKAAYNTELTSEQLTAASSKANVTQREERGTGSVTAKVYKFYFSHKLFWWITAIGVIIFHRFIDVFVQMWLAKWSAANTKAGQPPTAAEEGHPTAAPGAGEISPGAIPTSAMASHFLSAHPTSAYGHHMMNSLYDVASASFTATVEATSEVISQVGAKLPPHTRNFLIVFVTGDILLVIFQMIKATLILLVCCWTGRVVYMQMFNKLLRAPMSFFDTTPKGRIAARCSNDTDRMDNRIGDPLSLVVTAITTVLASVFMVFAAVGWWVLALLPIFLAYYAVYNRMIGAFRDLTRLEGNTKAPLSTVFSESLNGLFTLRAFNRQSHFITDVHSKVDSWQRVVYFKYSAERWLSLRMDLIGTSMTLLVAVFGIFNTSLNPGMMAVALTSLLLNTDIFSDLIHGITHVESYMNSVERIQQYTKLETERPAIIDAYRPPESWPSQGRIEFDKVSFRYRPGLPLVLNEMSFVIKPGEKIGVVGRTGAGKSSLLTALLSLSPLAGGKILIDKFDINKMGVGDLRSRLSIIPQDPVIFEGSIRHNIDPFGTHSDDEIWTTLRRIHLIDVIQGLPLKLDSELAEDGANFSLGQRQLLCVGRALLKRSKILLLDEASSSIDLETDYLLQKTLRTEFSECTTITIAHRLATIMDSDRVLVLDAGSVKEFDHPAALLANSSSLFYHLHQQTQTSASAAHVPVPEEAQASSSMDLI